MSRRLYFFLFVSLFITVTKAKSQNNIAREGAAVITERAARAHISFLASGELAGREAGTQGGRIAAEYIAACLCDLGLQPFSSDDSYFHPFTAVSRERQQRKPFYVHHDSVAAISQSVHRRLDLRNVIGCIPGKKQNEFVIVGAHYDHLGTDPSLYGDSIYNGADDNASGVSAVLQIARAFVSAGVRPERTVLFAYWDGEEKGLLGSKAFLQDFPRPERIKAYINFDMIGRNHFSDRPDHVVYFFTASRPEYGEWLKDDITRYALPLAPDYRPWENPTGGSDNAPFARLGIPIIWYHTDGHEDYHLPSDEAGKINYGKTVAISRAAWLAALRLALAKD